MTPRRRSPSSFQRGTRTGDYSRSETQSLRAWEENLVRASHAQATSPDSLAFSRKEFFQWDAATRSLRDVEATPAFFPGKTIPGRQTGPLPRTTRLATMESRLQFSFANRSLHLI